MRGFGREICGLLPVAEKKEWLVTNGIGGFAMGTVSGLLTRRYHGLLVATLDPPLGRTLLLAKLDESVSYRGQQYPLFTNRWSASTHEPDGYRFLERFHLARSVPVWTYAFSDALMEKRLWMQRGENTTYVQYRLIRGSGRVNISAKALINYRDYHSTTSPGNWKMKIEPVNDGLAILPFESARPYYLLSQSAKVNAHHDWYSGFYLSQEAYRGQDEITDAHLFAGLFEWTLSPGEEVTLVASTDDAPNLDGAAALEERKIGDKRLLYQAHGFLGSTIDSASIEVDEHQALQQLVLAADQFIVHRPTADDPDGRSVIAGYPWFGDWGRDTMIALPGLTLATGRAKIAARIIRTFGRYVNNGMLPNRFPDAGEQPEYNTVDATLWYFEAIRAYAEFTGDFELIAELFPILQDIIVWHKKQTRFNIRLDNTDGLLYAGEPGVQLTWMDAKVGDWVVTPRIGKPVEINALWYNALNIMIAFANHLNVPSDQYEDLARQSRRGFARFWNEDAGYCYDLIDGLDGSDSALRPNQLLAVSLAYSPFDKSKQQAVVDSCARYLLTSLGLRSLSPNDPSYIGIYGGDQGKRDAAYHQGTAWAWLLGPFVTAYLRVYGDNEAAREFLRPLLFHLNDHGIGSISEIFDGAPPFTPRGCPA
ncbi:MAG: amylo-alpha-1,6-glucosidase, partial [Candidatus Neomarinimicrobiota bacterium]